MIQQSVQATYQLQPAIARSIKTIRRQQGFSREKMANQLCISTRLYTSYETPSYKQSIPVHILAAFCWITQSPFVEMLRNTLLEKQMTFWSDRPQALFVYIGHLSSRQFDMLLGMISSIVNQAQYYPYTYELEGLDAASPFPIEQFRRDYYSSLGRQLVQLRQRNQLSREQIAEKVGWCPKLYTLLEQGAVSHISIDSLVRYIFTLQITDYDQLLADDFILKRVEQRQRARIEFLLPMLDSLNELQFQRLLRVASEYSDACLQLAKREH